MSVDHMSPTSPYGRTMYGRCGALSKSALATDRRNVTCASCLRSLAKLDREFRTKARRRFMLALPRHETLVAGGHSGLLNVALCHGLPVPPNAGAVTCGRCLAARAIAREEGRGP